jgi:hypothetical protein
MSTEECRVWRERLGALALGQLDPDERAATESHLEGCPGCRAEYEALAPVATLLSRADPDRLTPVPTPPARLGDRIARRIAAERRAARRRRVRMGMGMGAAAAAAAAVLVAVVLTGGSPKAPASKTVAFRSLPKKAWAEASLQPRAWGTDVSVRVYGFHAGDLCRVWLRRADGTLVPAGSFRYVYGEQSDPPRLSSAVAQEQVTAVVLRAGSKTYVAPVPSRPAGAGARTTS